MRIGRGPSCRLWPPPAPADHLVSPLWELPPRPPKTMQGLSDHHPWQILTMHVPNPSLPPAHIWSSNSSGSISLHSLFVRTGRVTSCSWTGVHKIHIITKDSMIAILFPVVLPISPPNAMIGAREAKYINNIDDKYWNRNVMKSEIGWVH